MALAALNHDLVAPIDPPGVALAAAIRLTLGGGHAMAARSIGEALANDGNACGCCRSNRSCTSAPGRICGPDRSPPRSRAA
jgi:hypothetical protein